MDKNTFVASDQREREIILDALTVYTNVESDETRDALVEMISRLEQTFSWFRRDYCKVELGRGILCCATMVNGKCSDGHN